MEINIYRNCLAFRPHFFRGLFYCRGFRPLFFPSALAFPAPFLSFFCSVSATTNPYSNSVNKSSQWLFFPSDVCHLIWSYASYRFCLRFKCSLFMLLEGVQKSVILICFDLLFLRENQSVLSEIVHGSLPFLRIDFVLTVSACSYHHGKSTPFDVRSIHHTMFTRSRLLTLTIYALPSMIAIFCFAATTCPLSNFGITQPNCQNV